MPFPPWEQNVFSPKGAIGTTKNGQYRKLLECSKISSFVNLNQPSVNTEKMLFKGLFEIP